MNRINTHKKFIIIVAIAVTKIMFVQSDAISQITFKDLLTVDPRGGTIIRFPGFDLTSVNAHWKNMSSSRLKYVPNISGTYGCYQAMSSATFQESGSGVELKPNRTYIISALIRTNFADRSTNEVSMYIDEWTADRKNILYQRPHGVPAKTNQTADGWMRFEREFTTSGMADAKLFTFDLRLSGFRDSTSLFQIADIALIELPEKKLVPFSRGDGVTFRGGPGKIPIKVESLTDDGKKITVVTTAAEYIFDKNKSTIEARQRIDMKRSVAILSSSVSLKGLVIINHDDLVAVMANTNITFGIQCDGLLMMSPQVDVALTLQSQIGGKWNRLRDGYLMVQDDFGGMTVHPAIPVGTGRVPRYTELDKLDFSGFKSTGIPLGNKVQIWQQFSDDRLSSQLPGWRVKWLLSPGERLGFSVSPVRTFDWNASFNEHYRIMRSSTSEALNESPANIYILWGETQRAYGLSYGWIRPKNPSVTKDHITSVHNAGKKATVYMSAYFYYSRDPEEFVNNVKEWRDTFGIDGIYSDGLPMEWLISYEEMRMLRELFPDGYLALHETGIWANGGPPCSASDIASPFITAYSDFTLTAEGTTPSKPNEPLWNYARYMGTKFRQGNSPVGMIMGYYWKVPGPQFPNIAKICLVYGGRYWMDNITADEYKSIYLPLLNQLRDLWSLKGSDPYFYDRYYLPKAQSITGYFFGRAGMPIETINGHLPGTVTITLTTNTVGGIIRYTTDGSEPTSSSKIYSEPLNFTRVKTLKAITFMNGLDSSRVFVLDISAIK